MSATLGGLIKDLRLQKNTSQMEIALALGWTEPSRLSRIEQGKVGRPSRTFIVRLADILKLTDEEKNHLMLVGNYLPDKNEIIKVREILKKQVHSWQYPVKVYDFSWRLIDLNQKTLDVYQQNSSVYSTILHSDVTILDVIFHPEFILNKFKNKEEEKKRRNFLISALANYKRFNRTRTNEDWYIGQIRRLMPIPIFKELWQELSVNNTEISISLGNFGYKSILNHNFSGKYLNFYYFIEPIIKDPRIFIEINIPADAKTYEFFA